MEISGPIQLMEHLSKPPRMMTIELNFKINLFKNRKGLNSE